MTRYLLNYFPILFSQLGLAATQIRPSFLQQILHLLHVFPVRLLLQLQFNTSTSSAVWGAGTVSEALLHSLSAKIPILLLIEWNRLSVGWTCRWEKFNER